MRSSKVYGPREVVVAYVDAQRPPYPHGDFRVFWRGRLAALESAYDIRMDPDGLPQTRAAVLWMLFSATVQSFLDMRGPRAGFLEDSLLNVVIEQSDTAELKLRETESRLHSHLEEARKAHLDLLEGLFVCIWGPLEHPLTSAELAARGFDDSTEPQICDYHDEM